MPRKRASPQEIGSMIATGKITRERSCDGKARFNTAEKAVKAARKWNEKEGGDLTPYACAFCHGFHLTSNKEQ